MNRVLSLTLILLLISPTGCKKSDDTASSSGGSGGASANSGDPEAVKVVQDELDRHWVKAGDGWMSQFPAKTNVFTGQRAGPESMYRQVKELKFDLETSELSDSDKLNGVTFRGTCDFHSVPVRVYGDPSAFGPPAWGPWHPSIDNLTVQKVKGKWDVYGTGWFNTGEKPPQAIVTKLLAAG
jgi:hypothetical protein